MFLYCNNIIVPAPEAVVIFQSRETPLYEGTAFSLSCLITPNRTGVDTEFVIQRSFMGPETSATERISLSDTVTSFDDIQLSFSFSPLILNDTGIYECSAIAISIVPNITASDPVTNETTLSILGRYIIVFCYNYSHDNFPARLFSLQNCQLLKLTSTRLFLSQFQEITTLSYAPLS